MKIEFEMSDFTQEIQKTIISNVTKLFELKEKELLFEINKQFANRLDTLVDSLTQGLNPKMVERTKKVMSMNLNKWVKRVINEDRRTD